MALRGLLVAVALILSGCLRSTTTVVVTDDGSGTTEVVLAVDGTAAETAIGDAGPALAAGLAGTEAEQICEQFRQLAVPTELPPSASVEPFDDGPFCGNRIDFTFADGADLARSLDMIAGGQAADIDQFVLRQEGDEWVFEGPLVGLTDALRSTLSSLPRVVVTGILSESEVTYELTMPGTAVEGVANADVVDGGTFLWNVDLDDPPALLQARTTTAGGSGLSGSSMLGLVLVALGALAALGLIGLALVKRSQRAVPADSATWTATDPAAGAALWPTGSLPEVDPFADGEATVAATQSDQVAAEPRWDAERGAWVADDPVDGLLVHDDEAGLWRRA